MSHRPRLLARALRQLGRRVKGGRSWGSAVQSAWRAAPVPWTPHFHESDLGHGVTAVEMSRVMMGHQWMTVRTFLVENGADSARPGTLVDAGLACMAPRLAELATARGVRQCVVTHHHEDHCGGAAALCEAGVDVHASARTAALMRPSEEIDGGSVPGDGLPLRWYQHLMWSQAPSCRGVRELGSHVEFAGGLPACVMEVPGHCEDQVAFWVPDRGLLFSGDAFIHERPRYFRSDEDFHGTVASLRRLLELDFEHLLCAHRPRMGNGKEALRQKLQWMESLWDRIKTLHDQGWGDVAIAREVLPRTWFAIGQEFLTLGDLSSLNVVQSALYGPLVRPEVDDVMQRLRQPG